MEANEEMKEEDKETGAREGEETERKNAAWRDYKRKDDNYDINKEGKQGDQRRS